MLRGIPKILPPDMVKYMMEMGHSDFMILADANFPGTAHAKRMIRMDSVELPTLLDAVLSMFPLDNFVDDNVKLMKNLPTEPVPEIWPVYREIIKKHDTDKAFKDFTFVDRLPFYDMAEKAYLIVQTGDEVRYGNIVLQKGCC